MSLGKLNTFIDIITTAPTKDAEGFVTHGDNILASVRAYKEVKNAAEKWANMAQFSAANAIFRFRKIPSLTVTPQMVITDTDGRYKILSVDDLRGRGMYVEAVCEKVEGSA